MKWIWDKINSRRNEFEAKWIRKEMNSKWNEFETN